MRRNVLICLLALGLTGGIPVLVAGDDGAGPADIAPESSTVALGQLVLRDDFADGQKGSMWRVYNEDPNTSAIVETNGRLEFRSIAASSGRFAGYVANAWRIDPRADFAIRVNAHYDLKTMAGGWITLGITPNAETLRACGVEIGLGCVNLLPVYSYERLDGIDEWERVSRVAADTVFYISYTAKDDTLYISNRGYGAENAWMSFPGLVQGEWEGEPLFVYVGGRAEGLGVDAGRAYFDNFLVENGVVIEAALRGVYRFWSPKTNSHFYTMNEWEKEDLLINCPATWIYEGVVFYAYPDATDPAAKPVYRFWSDKHGKHFYTISEAEKKTLMDEKTSAWAYEGIAFYAFPKGKQPPWTQPVYRFWCSRNNAHFYTIDEAEKNAVLQNYGDVWQYEGIAWYGCP